MNTPGIPSTRWHDATLLPKDEVAQTDNLKAHVRHGSRRQYRHPYAGCGKGNREPGTVGRRRSASDHLGGARRTQERHLSAAGCDQLRDRTDRALLPIARCNGASRSSSRSSNPRTTWRSCISSPRSSASPDRMFRNIKVSGNLPVAGRCPARNQPRRLVDRLLRPVARATEVAYGPPGRLRHEALRRRRPGRTRATTTACRGRAGARRHSGIPARRLLYNTNLSIKEGGGTFRARFGVEREETLPDGTKRKVSLLGNGYYSKDSEIKDGYPEFTYGVLKKLGWDKDLTEAELAVINKINPTTPDAVSWSIDLVRRHPARRDRARMYPVR